MKKFLTVLLVIAVMFTFSFGTAFAADPVTETGSYMQNLAQAKATLTTQLDAAKAKTVKGLANEYTQAFTGGTLTIAKAVYEKVADDVYADYMNVLAIAYKQLSDAYTDAADKSSLDTKSAEDVLGDLKAETVKSEYSTEYAGEKVADILVASAFDNAVTSDGVDTYLRDTLEYAFQGEKDRVLGELGKIDLSLYSDDVMDKVNDAYKTTYAQLAAETKADYIAKAGLISIEAKADKSTIETALKALQDYIAPAKLTPVKKTYDNKYTVTYKFAAGTVQLVLPEKTTDLKTKDELGTSNATLEAEKMSAKADAQANAAAYYQDALARYNSDIIGATEAQKATSKDRLDKAVKEKDAYLEVEYARIDEATASPSADAFTFSTWGDATYTTLVKKYNDVADLAAISKYEVEKNGELKYDATKVDENLEDAKVLIYVTGTSLDAKAILESVVLVDAKNATEDVAWAKEKAIAQMKDKLETALYNKDGSCKYYDVEKAKVEAKYQEVLDKINAATTVKQVEQVNKVPALTGITVKADTVTAIKSLPKYSEELAKVKAYVDYLNSGLNSWNDGYRAFTTDDLAKFYAKNGARTNAEIQALLSEAKAMAEALPTNKDAAASKKAVEDQVAALPAYLTLADKDAVVAAWTAADDLGETLTNQAKLDAAVSQLDTLEKAAIDKAVAALPTIAKITVADKAAVRAAREAADAYDATAMYANYYDDSTLVKYEEAVRSADMANVAATINALSANATKAEVEAARAAYDAFVAEYQDALHGFDAREVVNIDKLTYLEAQLKANEVEAVESLKLKANSTVKKGSITVKWTVTGDAAAADGFQVWKSTKMNSGFKKAFTTTKTSYKNTKGLKKGTKYYYKVRAYKVVDGKNVYSDWSNKAYRTAK